MPIHRADLHEALLDELEELHARVTELEANVFSGMWNKAKSIVSKSFTAHNVDNHIHDKLKVSPTKDNDDTMEFSYNGSSYKVTKGGDAKTFLISKDGGPGMAFKSFSELDTLLTSFSHPQSQGVKATAQDVVRYSRAVMRCQMQRT